jgi:hypothetical protein
MQCPKHTLLALASLLVRFVISMIVNVLIVIQEPLQTVRTPELVEKKKNATQVRVNKKVGHSCPTPSFCSCWCCTTDAVISGVSIVAGIRFFCTHRSLCPHQVRASQSICREVRVSALI